MASEKSNDRFFNKNPSPVEEVGSPLSDHTSLSDGEHTEEQPPAYTINPAVTTTAKSPIPEQLPAPAQTRQSSQLSCFQKPVAIPAVDSAFDAPFIRAYPPILKNYQLPREVFYSFLDRLNKAIASSPPLQVLDVTGGILNSVPVLFPLHWIGHAVSGLANMGNQGVSKNRTDNLIKDANKDIFRPRGLNIEIAKFDALAHIAKIPVLDSQGKVSRQAPLLQQLLAAKTHIDDTGVNDNSAYTAIDAQQSRIQMLQPWIVDLELDILPWTSKSKLARFNVALKKYNNTDKRETKRGKKRLQESTQSQAYMNNGQEEDDDPFRKCLWLIIREVERENVSTAM